MKWTVWYFFSEESLQKWYGYCAGRIPPGSPPNPFGETLGKRLPLLFFLHLVVFTTLAETGVDCLEPAAINWFWAPIVAAVMYPTRSQYPQSWLGLWNQLYPRAFFYINWFIGAVVVTVCLWTPLKFFDQRMAHPLRDAIGRGLGLGGQTGLLIAICIVFGVLAAWHEVWLYRQPKEKR